MCAGAAWRCCHRHIIAGYLLAEGEVVLHILSAGKIGPARPTPAALRQPDGTPIYPAETG